MEYQKIMNLAEKISLVQKIVDFHGTCNQIRFKISMLKSVLCDYAYILLNENISVANRAGPGADGNDSNNIVILKNDAPFTDCMSEINITQVDNAKDTSLVMSMYNLIEYNNSYSKTLRSLWQYCKGKAALNNNNNIVDFNGVNNTGLFKVKITGKNGTKMLKWLYH